jgi:hypothetical protein
MLTMIPSYGFLDAICDTVLDYYGRITEILSLYFTYPNSFALIYVF